MCIRDRAQKGERVNGEYPYGYIPDPNNRHHLIPDPETAPIVKQVFAMFVSGVRTVSYTHLLLFDATI